MILRAPESTSELPLVRPSELARFWKLHPRTVQDFIRSGRLAAVRTPGNHFRVRVADVHAFCAREDMPVPESLVRRPRRLVVATANDTLARALKSALRGTKVKLEMVDDPVLAIVGGAFVPPTVIAFDAKTPMSFAARAARALRDTPLDPKPRVVVFDVPSAAKCESFLNAGATRTVTRARRSDLANVLVELATE